MATPKLILYDFLALIAVICIAVAIVITPGCRKKTSPMAPPADVMQEEATPPRVETFLNAAKAAVSEASAKSLGHLHVSGLALLVVTVALRFLSGNWKPALTVFGLGALCSAYAVLLTEYSRVVLLIPLCALVVLVGYAVKLILEWWTGYRAFKAAAREIEAADTGDKSAGQTIKNRFARAGIAPILDKALKPLKKEWDDQAAPAG